MKDTPSVTVASRPAWAPKTQSKKTVLKLNTQQELRERGQTDSAVTFHRCPGHQVAGCQERHCHLLDACSSAPCTAGLTVRPGKAAGAVGEGRTAEPPPCRWQSGSRGLHGTASLPVSSREEGLVLAWVRTQHLP